MHGFANPARFLRIARWLMPLCMVLGLVVAALALGWGVFFAPAERLQGETVRIVYLHVPSAWLGMAGWMGIAAASFTELVWRHPLAAIAARACAVPGTVFTAVCLLTGSLWGRPAWGTWWVWDGRLTSMLVLLFLYFGWMALSQASESADGSENRAPAIFGLVGAVNVPIIHYSVIWWNSQHQAPSITMGKSAMSGDFLVPLLAAMLGFTLIFVGCVLARMRAILANQQAEARLRRKAFSEVEF
ncbi:MULTISPECIES: heme ABC transporter permease CcmC [unclassified Novosphingobium]|uniref:heme ABC transporter permease CcmC n=1 Tax=unclassified Novosphingobium TaxID=2644732 RepID=UPI00135BB763|nr:MULTISPECIES: heme ABC transporter permease CcmC [unclassified Novosphingobium]